jgi:hypothetical protein
MKTVLQYRFAILMMALAFFSCKKEYSLENPKQTGYANYSLLDSLGNCTTASIHGKYKVDSVLTDSNYVLINVMFSSSGKYYINTDTINGMWFIDSGFALVTGPTVIKLKGYGIPILPNAGTFLLTHNNEACGFALTASDDDYLPATAGSFWRYQYIPAMIGTGGTNIDSFDVTVIPPTINFSNKTYFKFGTSLADTFYFAKQGNDYYEYSTPDFDYTFVFDQVDSFIEYIYLKSNQPAGTTWESPELGVSYGAAFGGTSKPGIAKDVFTIISVNQPYTVAGTTFQNTITIRRDILFKEAGTTSFIKVLDGTAMYAKGIGLIDQAINLPGGSTQSIPILRWKIN